MSARVVTRRIVFCLTVLVALGLPALARANAYRDVLGAYQRDGAVPACMFSSHELSAALKQEGTYDAEYFADFSNSIETALEARASGRCSAGGSGGSAGLPAVNPTGGASAGSGGGRLESLTASTGSGIPAPIVLMGVIAALVGLAAAAIGIARSAGWDPAWAVGWRHGASEAGYRLSAMAVEMGDWRRSTRRRPSD